MASYTGRPADPPLSPQQAVVYLAETHQLSVSDEYLRQRAKDGTIAHTRLSKSKFLFRKGDLDAWVQRSRVEAPAS